MNRNKSQQEEKEQYMAADVIQFLQTTAVEIFLTIASLVVGAFVESKWGMLLKIRKAAYKVFNSHVEAEIHSSFTGSLDEVEEKLKNQWREHYTTIDVQPGTPTTSRITIDNKLSVKLNQAGDTVTVLTDRIDTKMRQAAETTSKFIDTLEYADADSDLSLEEISVYLYLPYKSHITRFYLPDNVSVNQYNIDADYKEMKSAVNITEDRVKISPENYRDLEKAMKVFL